MYQMGYIEKYGTGITENIRRMQEARLLAPEIDLSAEFITNMVADGTLLRTKPSHTPGQTYMTNPKLDK